MDNLDKGENSIKFAMLYRDGQITSDELNRHNDDITKECRKYLIGKICERERANRVAEETVEALYERIGFEFGYSSRSMQHVISYARAVDQFYKTAPDIALSVLGGKIQRLSSENIIILSKMELTDVRIIIERLASEKTSVDIILKEQKEQTQMKKRGRPKQKSHRLPRKSVKDTPPDDPDSQIMALVYTIPSWISAVENNFMNTNFDRVSLSAHRRLINELNELKETAAAMILILRDEKY
jgi:hypothetical protein